MSGSKLIQSSRRPSSATECTSSQKSTCSSSSSTHRITLKIKPTTSIKQITQSSYYKPLRHLSHIGLSNQLRSILRKHSNHLLRCPNETSSPKQNTIKDSGRRIFDGDAILNSFLLNNGGYLDDSEDEDDDRSYDPGPIGSRGVPSPVTSWSKVPSQSLSIKSPKSSYPSPSSSPSSVYIYNRQRRRNQRKSSYLS